MITGSFCGYTSCLARGTRDASSGIVSIVADRGMRRKKNRGVEMYSKKRVVYGTKTGFPGFPGAAESGTTALTSSEKALSFPLTSYAVRAK